jgi:hypothetical protein
VITDFQVTKPTKFEFTIDFESLDNTFRASNYNPGVYDILNGYGSLAWSNIGVVSTQEYNAFRSGNGYGNNVVSGDNVAFNGFGNPGTPAADYKVDLVSGWFGAAWNDGLQVKVEGLVNGAVVATKSFVTNTTGPLLVTFDATFENLDSFRFSTSGGTKATPYPAGTQLVLDDLTVRRTGLTVEGDRIFVAGQTEADLLAMLDAAIEDAGGTTLSYGNGDTIRLEGVAKSELTLADFIYV